jgi:hypothetical protein
MVAVPHLANRLTIPVGASFDDFRARYETAVPRFDAAGFEALESWDAAIRAAAEDAPHGFMIYAAADAGAIMRLAGHSLRSITYLMGNHTIAERMYRHNPGVMLYAPLRTAIHEDASGATWFSVDQPSTRFGSFGDPAIAKVGVELDGKLARLLEHLGLPVPAALSRA